MKKYLIGMVLCWLMMARTSNAQSFVSIVAADGSGEYTTIQSAVNACPEDGKRHLIFVKNGVYKEMVTIPKNKLISLVGENRDKVILTFDRNRGKTVSSRTTAILLRCNVMRMISIWKI